VIQQGRKKTAPNNLPDDIQGMKGQGGNQYRTISRGNKLERNRKRGDGMFNLTGEEIAAMASVDVYAPLPYHARGQPGDEERAGTGRQCGKGGIGWAGYRKEKLRESRCVRQRV